VLLLLFFAVDFVATLTDKHIENVGERRILPLVFGSLCCFIDLLSEFIHALGEIGPVGSHGGLGLSPGYLGLEGAERC
jgi:hypothetical protein